MPDQTCVEVTFRAITYLKKKTIWKDGKAWRLARTLCRKQYSDLIASYSCPGSFALILCPSPSWCDDGGAWKGLGASQEGEVPCQASQPGPRRGSTPFRRSSDAFADWRSASFRLRTRDAHRCSRWLECSLLKDAWPWTVSDVARSFLLWWLAQGSPESLA
jgi:hypothetical protein